MGEWITHNLGELIEVQNGYAFKSTDFDDFHGIPVIKIKNIASGELRMDDIKFYPHAIEGLERFVIYKNDILIALTGSHVYQPSSIVGKIARYTNDGISLLNQRVGKIYSLNEKKTNEDYIYWFFKQWDVTLELALNAGGSANQANISGKLIKTLELELPPLPEQKAIASVLSSLDDKIDLLQRQNKTLEAMAETLFRQWFVEEAKDDWEDGFLGDVADINPNYQLKKGENSPYLEMSNLSTSSFHPKEWYRREFSSGMKFKNGDSLIARITPCLENGKTCFVTFLDKEEIGWGSTEYIVIRIKKPFHPFISYILAKDRDFREFAISSMTGSSGRQRAQSDVIKTYNIKIPPLTIIKKLNLQLAEIVPKLENNAKQIRTLEKLRDTLLPKLMSGEVQVRV